MDGSWGPQCWDLWAKYCMDEYGCSVQDCITPTGWAGGLYTRHPVSARVGEIFEKKDNTWNPMPGDVAIWQVCYPNYPSTHVAIVVDGIQGDSIDVITQNPEPSVHKLLPLQKAYIGYLHPRKNRTAATMTAARTLPAPTTRVTYPAVTYGYNNRATISSTITATTTVARVP